MLLNFIYFLLGDIKNIKLLGADHAATNVGAWSGAFRQIEEVIIKE